MANFVMWYGPANGNAIRPPMEPTNTRRPLASRTSGSSDCVTRTWPTRLTSSWAWRSSIEMVSIGPG